MSDALFLDADSLGALAGWVTDYLFVGFGLCLSAWVVGIATGFVFELLRGGF